MAFRRTICASRSLRSLSQTHTHTLSLSLSRSLSHTHSLTLTRFLSLSLSLSLSLCRIYSEVDDLHWSGLDQKQVCHNGSWLSRTTICASRWLPRASPTLNQSQPFPVLIFPGRVRPPVRTQSKSVNSYLCSHESVRMKRCRTCSWLFRMTICASRFEQLTDSSFPRYKFSRSRPRPGTKPARFSQPLIATPDMR